MLDSILDSLRKFLKSRFLPIVIIYSVLLIALISRLFYLQIIKGEEHAMISTSRSERTRSLKSTRGDIYDCTGKLLAYNELSYNITLEDTGKLTKSEDKNTMMLRLITIIEKNGDTVDTDFPIRQKNNGKYEFTVSGNALKNFKRDAYFAKSIDSLKENQINATADEMIQYFRYDDTPQGPRFRIGKEYSDEQALKILAIRYALQMKSYEKYIPLTIASNIKPETIAAIKESGAELPGVKVEQDTHRVYNDSIYFAHIIGYTGLISQDALEEKKLEDPNTDYDSNDQIGKSGVELSFEKYLKGEKGTEKVSIDSSYRVVDVLSKKEPTAGDDIYLTIDADLQKACYTILEKRLAGILLSKLNNSMDAGTKGESASDIRVPIYDVYYAFIKNNVLNLEHFQKKKATAVEKNVYNRFKSQKKSTLSAIRTQLNKSNTMCDQQISEDMQENLNFIYKKLVSDKILLTAAMDHKDKKYKLFQKNKISTSKFLQYAISKNWVSLPGLGITSEDYLSTSEIYKKMVAVIMDDLNQNVDFYKIIYKHMVYSYQLSGSEICLLLFDQKVLEYKEEDYQALQSGSISSYDFIRSKIKNLEITPAQLALEPCSGSIVITDVNSGKVRALVSYPSYDNNKFANYINADYYSYITNNTSSPLLNRATQQKTAPGSTYKMLTSVATMDSGVIDSNSTIKDLHEFTKIKNPSPKCWSSSSHGTINVVGALRDSCNYFFYELGYRLGDGHPSTIEGEQDIVDNQKGLGILNRYAKMFGLTDTSGVELTESDPKTSDKDVVRSAIGQGTNNYTPIQLSKYVSTIANKGTCYNLTILDSIQTHEKEMVKKQKKDVYKKLSIAGGIWASVQEGMHQVVINGTVKKLFEKMDVAIAGKTGTAQESAYKPNHALFVSFAPVDNPQISVTCVIPNGYTSSNAAELARDVYKYYYDEESREKLLNKKVTTPEMDGRAFSD